MSPSTGPANHAVIIEKPEAAGGGAMIDHVRPVPERLDTAPRPTAEHDSPPRPSRGRTLRRRWPCPHNRWHTFGIAPRRWWPDLLLVAGLLAVGYAVLWPSPLVELDIWLRDLGQRHLEFVPYWIARALNLLGQGSPLAVLSLALCGWAAWTFRTVRPLVLFTAVYLTLGLVVGLKILLARPAPRYPDPSDPPYVDAAGAVLFGAPGTSSYPSGHAVNAVVWYSLIVMLLGAVMTRRQRTLLVAVPPVLVVVSQTYLGFHWLSDAPAGFFLGVLIVRAMLRVDWAGRRWPLIPAKWDVNLRYEPVAARRVRDGVD